MNNGDMNSIFEQINNLKKPVTEPTEAKLDTSEDALREVLNSVSEEIQRVLDEVTFGIMQMLDILNKEEQSIDIEDSHMIQIKEYLALLDLIMEIDLESLPEVNQKSKVTVITQPGMRYAQANAIVENLLLDAKFQELSIQERQRILERLLNEIRGRMMENS